MDVNEELKFFGKIHKKKIRGGGKVGVGLVGGGVRVDVKAIIIIIIIIIIIMTLF